MQQNTPPTSTNSVEQAILAEMDEVERKAWDSLKRYKFTMYGYWAAIWVHLNRLSGAKRPNPWKSLVQIAKDHDRPEPDHKPLQPPLYTELP